MARLEMRRSVDAPPGVVWDVITDPDLYADVAPNLTSVEILSGEGEGMVRRCVDTDGNAWNERVTRWEDGREFSVAVDVADSDFHRRLFDHMEGTWGLTERADDVQVEMCFEYDTKWGPLGTLVSKYFQYKGPGLMEAIFEGWEAAIADRLADDSDDGREPNALYR